MKKTILASLGMVFLLAVAIAPSAKAADSPDWPFLYQEELTAKAIYTQMAETFDNSPYYEKLIKAEDCHAKAIENILARKGMTADANIPAAQVSHDELTALKDAQAYEKTDIANLQTALALTTDAKEQKVLGNQIKASENHAKSLETAIQAYESGQTDLTQITCTNPNGQQGQGGQGREKAPHKGQGPGQKSGKQGQGMGQNSGQQGLGNKTVSQGKGGVCLYQ